MGRCMLPALVSTISNINQLAAFDRLMQIAQEFVHHFPLGCTAWNGRDFGPEAALLSIMRNDFDLHVGFPKKPKEGVFCRLTVCQIWL
jgi:hypothetical protein